MKLHTGHLHGPHDRRQLSNTQLVSMPPIPRKVHPNGLNPGRRPPRQPLLMNLLPINPGGKAVHHARPLPQGTNNPVPHGDVVPSKVKLGLTTSREVNPVGTTEPNGPIPHLKLHSRSTLTHNRNIRDHNGHHTRSERSSRPPATVIMRNGTGHHAKRARAARKANANARSAPLVNTQRNHAGSAGTRTVGGLGGSAPQRWARGSRASAPREQGSPRSEIPRRGEAWGSLHRDAVPPDRGGRCPAVVLAPDAYQ